MNKIIWMTDDAEAKAKDKAPRFTQSEVDLLLDLHEKYSYIIGSPKKDQRTMRKKEEAWKSLAGEFNQEGVTNRSIGQLKFKCYNWSRAVKMKMTKEKSGRKKSESPPVISGPSSSALQIVKHEPDLNDSEIADVSFVTLHVPKIERVSVSSEEDISKEKITRIPFSDPLSEDERRTKLQLPKMRCDTPTEHKPFRCSPKGIDVEDSNIEQSQKKDNDLFLMSLRNGFKMISEEYKLDAESEILEVVEKYKAISSRSRP